MSDIAVVNLGTGNLHSVVKALEHGARGRAVTMSRDPEVILGAARVVLPGQGALSTWVGALAEPRLAAAIDTVLRDRPVLGICLGLEALYRTSDEDGGVAGLDLLGGTVRRFGADPAFDRRLKVPHMGWNEVRQTRPHPLWHGIEDRTRFYFVHSYYACSERAAEIMGTTEYGHSFTSAAGRDNLFAVQFHPEKSRGPGLRLMRNFIDWNGKH